MKIATLSFLYHGVTVSPQQCESMLASFFFLQTLTLEVHVSLALAVPRCAATSEKKMSKNRSAQETEEMRSDPRTTKKRPVSPGRFRLQQLACKLRQ